MRLVALICCIAAATGCQGGKLTRYSAVGKTGACAPGTGEPGNPSEFGPNGVGGSGATCQPGFGPDGSPTGGPGGPGVCQPRPGGWQQPGLGGYQPGCRPGPGVCQPGPGPQVKAPPAVQAPAEEAPKVQRTAAAVAPDILLIPKTVLVPYAPHVPTGPVRLAGVLPAGGVVQTEERVTSPAPTQPPPAVAAPNPQINEALDQVLQGMKALNNKITELEARVGAPVCVPPPCPAPARTGPHRPFFGTGPCAPGVSYPPTPAPAYPPIPGDGFVLPPPKPLSPGAGVPMTLPIP